MGRISSLVLLFFILLKDKTKQKHLMPVGLLVPPRHISMLPYIQQTHTFVVFKVFIYRM